MTLARLVFANFEPTSLSDDLWERARRCADDLVLISADSPEYRSVVERADGLILRLGMSADADFLARASELRYLGMFGTDYGRIDIEAARQRGVVVSNIADYSTASVAEFALGMALDLFRDFSVERQRAGAGDLDETRFVGRELSSLKVGIVGAGNLGRHVARILSRGIGADVSYWSRTRRPGFEADAAVTYRPLDELVAQSDLLSVHLALNGATEGILDARLVRSLPPGAGLVNTAPNELLDVGEVLARCEAGDLRFATDHGDELTSRVLVQALRTANVFIYPPIGYATGEAARRKTEVLVANIEAFLAGAPTNHVNP
jgi:phosphoglycerate dehydrogenase-like enzyme